MAPRPTSIRDYNTFFFDCETGGLDPRTSDLVEVAAILTDPSGEKILDTYSAKVFPKLPVGAKAAEINGYSAEKWATEAVEMDAAIFKLNNMAHDAIFTAHNASFDWGFFEAALKVRGMRWRSDYHKYDTVALALPLLRNGLVPNLKLTTLTAYFGIPHDAHRALADVEACRQVFLRLMKVYDGAVGEFVKLAAPTPPAA